MGKTNIDYVTRSYNPNTGCLHTLAECPTSDKCYARRSAKRFSPLFGPDFQPRWHEHRLQEPLGWKEPQRVAVCFQGDLFGDWNQSPAGLRYIRRTLDVVFACPQHTFLFLTKRPEHLARWNPWPVNAWVGTSITGAECPGRALEMLEALMQVKGAPVRWVSYEPVLGPLTCVPEIGWLVIGAQTGPRAIRPKPEWLKDACVWAFTHGIPIFEKANLRVCRALTQQWP